MDKLDNLISTLVTLNEHKDKMNYTRLKNTMFLIDVDSKNIIGKSTTDLSWAYSDFGFNSLELYHKVYGKTVEKWYESESVFLDNKGILRMKEEEQELAIEHIDETCLEIAKAKVQSLDSVDNLRLCEFILLGV